MSSVMKSPVRAHIRWMIRRDMPEVLAIEHASYPHPWCEEEFLRVLRQRNCIGMVAEHGERVLGFMIYELHRNHLELLNFAVSPSFRRQGIGHQMMAKLVGKLSSHRRTRITLVCRETLLDAQLFFRVEGFRAVEVMRECFADTAEDGYVMQYLYDETVLEAAPASGSSPRISSRMEG
jgi:ribosomal-protein-alanine N-acetyltransferase